MRAVEDGVWLIGEMGRRHGVEQPIQMTVATTDASRTWAFRYSSDGQSRSLFYSTKVWTLRKLHPDLEVLSRVSDQPHLLVSEPLPDLPGAWNDVPESSYGVVHEAGTTSSGCSGRARPRIRGRFRPVSDRSCARDEDSAGRPPYRRQNTLRIGGDMPCLMSKPTFS